MLLRIWLALIFVVGGYVLMLGFYVNSHTNMAYDARMNELQHIVNIAKNTIQPLLEKQSSGIISKEESMAEGIELLRKMTFVDNYGNNYIFMSSYNGTMLVQPFQQEKQGLNQWELQDVNGKYLIKELVKAATSPEGKGFVDYYYLPPGRDKAQKKISYVIGIPEWNAYLGTGMYTGDIERYHHKSIRTVILLTFTLIVLIIFSNLILVRPLYLCHRQLLVLFDKIRKDPDTAPVVSLSDFKDDSEGRRLLVSFKAMLTEVYSGRHELKVSKERFDSVLEATNDGIWDWDIETDAVYYSPRWKSMLGYQDDEISGVFSSFRDLIHPDDAAARLVGMQEYLGGTTQSYKQIFRMAHKDGHYLWILARGHVLRDSTGKPYRMIGSHTDITEQRHAATALELQRNEMAHLSRVAVMGELTAAIAHEINQPLAAIGANTHAALRFLSFAKPDLGRVHEILSDIVVDNTRAAEVIRRLRAMLIKGEVEVRPFDLNLTVYSAMEIIRGVALSNNVKLEADLAHNLPKLLGDSIQIQQVLVNLLLNAIESIGPQGEGGVKIRTFKQDDKIVATVSDTGTTIPEDNLEKIFEPFFSTKKDGMGMGLSICRTIAEAHGGEIVVASNLRHGATFSLIFPTALEV